MDPGAAAQASLTGPATDAAALRAWRREQRTRLLAERQALSTSAHRAASRAIGERLAALLQASRPAIVGAYWPIRREFNPLPLLQQLIDSGTRVALPSILQKNAPLEFRLWRPGARLAVGVYDIPYPAEGEAVTPDTLVIPLVGYDLAGYRLGYGGGYYDRTVPTLSPCPRLIGLGFTGGQLQTIYPQAYDIRMDCIVTDAATLELAGNRA
ncbi:MAG TPA: 5-formyltetrahydrofolate cyclo-ligase [Steroidobacteraceae bacterium]|nr:5-formyltetrahydrofolate cyclo-ligase [Steroidobacteraceae bacterium]